MMMMEYESGGGGRKYMSWPILGYAKNGETKKIEVFESGSNEYEATMMTKSEVQ